MNGDWLGRWLAALAGGAGWRGRYVDRVRHIGKRL